MRHDDNNNEKVLRWKAGERLFLLTSVKDYIPMNIPTAYLTAYLTSNLAVVVKVYTAILISVILWAWFKGNHLHLSFASVSPSAKAFRPALVGSSHCVRLMEIQDDVLLLSERF